jgi:hypothetical protein
MNNSVYNCKNSQVQVKLCYDKIGKSPIRILQKILHHFRKYFVVFAVPIDLVSLGLAFGSYRFGISATGKPDRGIRFSVVAPCEHEESRALSCMHQLNLHKYILVSCNTETHARTFSYRYICMALQYSNIANLTSI